MKYMFLDEFESQTSIQGSATTMLIRSVLSSNPKKIQLVLSNSAQEIYKQVFKKHRDSNIYPTYSTGETKRNGELIEKEF